MRRLFVGAFKPSKDDLGELWQGIVKNKGQKISHKLLHYIAERKAHGQEWEVALDRCQIPLTLVWGLLDPVSGAHVLEYAKNRLKDAEIIQLPDVSHYPQIEAPDIVSRAIRKAMS